MKERVKKALAVMSVLMIILPMIAWTPVAAAIDLTQKGTLTIVTEYDGKQLPDMEIEIYRIATAANESGGIKYSAVAGFAGELAGAKLNPNEMTAGENAELAGKLKTSAAGEIAAASGKTDSKGEVSFTDLEAGLYLVTQKTSNDVRVNNGRYNMQSFILPMPYADEASASYTVRGVFTHPKIEPKKGKLTLTKAIEGTGAPNSNFWFTIIFTHSESNAPLDSITLNGEKWDGDASISIRAGVTATFDNIPLGTQYDITEINIPTGFTFVSLTNNGRGTVETLAAVTLTAINRYRTTTTEPPTTSPPTTEPPTTTSPPTTEPPTTSPPTTEPPTTSPPTTEPPTTTQSSTEPTTTTSSSTESTTITTQSTTEPPTTPQPTTQPQTEPTIETTDEEEFDEPENPRIPLDNFPPGWYVEYDEEEDIWYVYDENGVPKGIIKVPPDEAVPDDLIPLANFTTEDKPRPNPGTGDTYTALTILFGMLLISGGIAVFIIRKKKKEKDNI